MTDVFYAIVPLMKWSLLAWLLVLAALVVIPCLRGDFPGQSLLGSGAGHRDPERIALLFTTIGVALYYFITCLGTDLADLPVRNGVIVMPDLPPEMLVALFGAQGGYLSGKIWRIFKGVSLP